MFDFDALNDVIGTADLLARGKQYESSPAPEVKKYERPR
jgi:hypothetical protein